MRLAIYSNVPWAPTGYGGQTALFAPRIAADGHDVAIIANYGLAGAPLMWEGLNILPMGYDIASNDVAPAHYAAWMAGEQGWLLTLYDVWPLKFPDDVPHVASWTPVDHYPVPVEVAEWARRHHTIAMSRFGQAAFADAGITARYVPHAFDPAVFRPTATFTDQTGRAVMGIPADAFVVMINAANKGTNPPRKGWGEMFAALGVVMGRHDDMHLYLHSDLTGFQGVNLSRLMTARGVPEPRTHVVDQYALRCGVIPPAALAALYSASDVLLATSLGEGFGIPVIEAQACGTPAIVTDATAQPEVLSSDGWKVPAWRWWDEPHAADFFVPKVDYIVDALEESYQRRDLGERSASIAEMSRYHVDRVHAEHMRPVIAEMESMLDVPTNVVPMPNRETRRAAARAK